MQKKEIRYELISENSSEGIIEIDKNGVIKTANNWLLKLLDLEESKVVENNIFDMDFLDEKTKKVVKEIIDKRKKDKKQDFISFEGTLQSKNPTQVIVKACPLIFDQEFYGVQLVLDADTEPDNGITETLQTNDNVIMNQELDTLNQKQEYDQEICELLQTIQESVMILKNQKIYDEQLMNIIEEQTSIGIEKIEQTNSQDKKLPEIDNIEISDLIEVEPNSQ